MRLSNHWSIKHSQRRHSQSTQFNSLRKKTTQLWV